MVSFQRSFALGSGWRFTFTPSSRLARAVAPDGCSGGWHLWRWRASGSIATSLAQREELLLVLVQQAGQDWILVVLMRFCLDSLLVRLQQVHQSKLIWMHLLRDTIDYAPLKEASELGLLHVHEERIRLDVDQLVVISLLCLEKFEALVYQFLDIFLPLPELETL